jgi:hypothetical protein
VQAFFDFRSRKTRFNDLAVQSHGNLQKKKRDSYTTSVPENILPTPFTPYLTAQFLENIPAVHLDDVAPRSTIMSVGAIA